MDPKKDQYIHFTLRERAYEIVKSGVLKLRGPHKSFGAFGVFGVSLLWGKVVSGVQYDRFFKYPDKYGKDPDVVGIIFNSPTVPDMIVHQDEVIWHKDVKIQNTKIVSLQEGIAKIKMAPCRYDREMQVWYGGEIYDSLADEDAWYDPTTRRSSMYQKHDHWLDQIFEGKFVKFAGNMNWQAVFMMGPPAAGKSTIKAQKYLKHLGFKNLDSDEFKPKHPDFKPVMDRETNNRIHLWSIGEQKREFEKLLASGSGEPFVYDGTGWDPEKMLRLFNVCKQAGYRIFLTYVFVPIEVAVFRNRGRMDRFVPEQAIIDKYNAVYNSFLKLRNMVDKYKVIPNFKASDLSEAKKDLALYPAPFGTRPPRPGDPDYGVPITQKYAKLASKVAMRYMRKDQ